MPAPRLLFLHGPAAVGKLTLARELSDRTGFALFHNHLTVDLLLALFPFGSPEFVHHRERLWLELIPEATRRGRSVIFTFHPERTVAPDFPVRLQQAVQAAGGIVTFIALHGRSAEIRRRLDTPARRALKKLTSAELHDQLAAAGAFDFPALPADCNVDTTDLSPTEAADFVIRSLALSSPPGPHAPRQL